MAPPLRRFPQVNRPASYLHVQSSVADSPLGPIEFALQGEGPPILISHGAAGGFDQGLLIAAPLVSQGYRLIAPSRDGYLRSPLSSASSPRSQADKYAALLDHLEIQSCAVLAVSSGAPASIEFALNHRSRCRAIVLASSIVRPLRPAFVGFLPRRLVVTILRGPAFRFLRVRAPNRLLLSALGVSSEDRRRLRSDPDAAHALQEVLLAARDPLEVRTPGTVADIRSLWNLRAYPFAALDIPVLAVHGSADRFAPQGSVAEAVSVIPRGSLEVIGGAGHLGIITHRNEVFSHVAKFLHGTPG